ncbi:hypothetical protein I5907_03095 [Panacibacter sp. DH6]|uniref:DUF5050 domain-containing protein n=1 Tax=Panacibacter microcysteis TaxID=2793269 RepID=A0A931E451_9BACT|nr:hypothetical protein [Panacibacter microcysteis]MBG9375201.1 hypothetical protein [Panacibacter microcysteis]
MTKILLLTAVILGFCSCQKDVTIEPPVPRVVYDSLIIYQVNNAGSNKGIFSKSLKTGDSSLLVANATMPYVANQRLVYIKSGKTVGYARLNGVSKFLADLTAPMYPSLSLDARLISVVDKSAAGYQLIVLDTMGNQKVIYTTFDELGEPEFSNDGAYLFFTARGAGGCSIFKINSNGGEALKLITAPQDAEFSSIAATGDRLYFLHHMFAGGKLSSEICSSDYDGKDFKQHTDFSAGWTIPGVRIDQLRDINNSALVFVSDNENNNREIFITKVENIKTLTRMTYSETYESYPSLVPDFVKDF